MLEITEVRMKRVNNGSNLKAVASITLDGAVVIHDVKLIQGDKGLFLAMPSRRGTDDKFWDVAHPVNQTTRDMIEKAVKDKYETLL